MTPYDKLKSLPDAGLFETRRQLCDTRLAGSPDQRHQAADRLQKGPPVILQNHSWTGLIFWLTVSSFSALPFGSFFSIGAADAGQQRHSTWFQARHQPRAPGRRRPGPIITPRRAAAGGRRRQGIDSAKIITSIFLGKTPRRQHLGLQPCPIGRTCVERHADDLGAGVEDDELKRSTGLEQTNTTCTLISTLVHRCHAGRTIECSRPRHRLSQRQPLSSRPN